MGVPKVPRKLGIVPSLPLFDPREDALVPNELGGSRGALTLGAGPMSTNPSLVPAGSRVLTAVSLPERSRPARNPSPVETTAALLRGRFTALVIWHLFWEGKRFYQLVRELEGVPRKALAHELEELERAGIVTRRVQGRGPGKVEYRLTSQGESLKIVVGAMYEWGLLARRPPTPASVSLLDEASS